MRPITLMRRLVLAAFATAALLLVVAPAGPGKRQALSAPLFDGRASRMLALTSTYQLASGSDTQPWACLCFEGGDIALVRSKRFGKAYLVTTGPDSHNPSWTPPYGLASSEVSTKRPVGLGQWDWYANSFKALRNWTPTDWGTVDQMNYPSIGSPPLEIDFDKYGVGIERSVGDFASVGASPPIHDVRRFFPVSSVLGKWIDFVVGVRWATDATGAIRVFTRCLECRNKRWVLRYSRDDIVTMQWGAGIMNQDGTSARDGQPMITLDKQGLYWGYNHPPSALPTNHILEMGMVRTSDEPSAMAAFP